MNPLLNVLQNKTWSNLSTICSVVNRSKNATDCVSSVGFSISQQVYC